MNEGSPGVLDAATERLVRELYPSLRRFAAVTGPPESDPDDLVQEALLRSIRTRPLTDLEHPGAYLRQAIVRLASNERRSTWRRTARLRRISHDLDPAATDDYPSDLADLFRLTPLARAVLYLAEVENSTHREVGVALGITESSSRMIASRARARLRQFIEEETA